MSRSYRRTPITGITCAESDKHDKTLAHRRTRRAAAVAVREGREPPHPYETEEPWTYAKDGKRWWTGNGHKELLRK